MRKLALQNGERGWQRRSLISQCDSINRKSPLRSPAQTHRDVNEQNENDHLVVTIN